jgi:hypothetical protein
VVTSARALTDARVLPPAGVVDVLAGDGNTLALTVDDGIDAEVVGAFIEFAPDTDVR